MTCSRIPRHRGAHKGSATATLSGRTFICGQPGTCGRNRGHTTGDSGKVRHHGGFIPDKVPA